MIAGTDWYSERTPHPTYTIVFAEDCSFESIKNAILAESVVAVEMVANFRAYGSLRYVNYAQFLWDRFYPQYEELCSLIGANMKLYYEGHEEFYQAALDAERRAEEFRNSFFGG